MRFIKICASFPKAGICLIRFGDTRRDRWNYQLDSTATWPPHDTDDIPTGAYAKTYKGPYDPVRQLLLGYCTWRLLYSELSLKNLKRGYLAYLTKSFFAFCGDDRITTGPMTHRFVLLFTHVVC